MRGKVWEVSILGGKVAIFVLVIALPAYSAEYAKEKKPEREKMVWFGSYLQPPPMEVVGFILEQLQFQSTLEQEKKLQSLYENLERKFPSLVQSYHDQVKGISKAIMKKQVKEQELEKSLKGFFELEREMLQNAITFWQSFLEILGSQKGSEFLGMYLPAAKERGFLALPFLGAMLAPLPEELGAPLAIFIDLKPEQGEQLSRILPAYVPSFPPLVQEYVDGLKALMEEFQKGFPFNWENIQKKANSLVETETKIVGKEISLWKEINGIFTEEQIGLYWPVFLWEKVKAFVP